MHSREHLLHFSYTKVSKYLYCIVFAYDISNHPYAS